MNKKYLPVLWRSNRKTLVRTIIFEDWFSTCWVWPEIVQKDFTKDSYPV